MDHRSFFALILIVFSVISRSGLADTHVIGQKGKKFSVDSITVKLGDTLVFKNEEKEVTHNVYSISPGNEFELRTQRPMTSTPVFLDPSKHHAGTADIECAIHPGMKLKLNIVK